MEVCGYCGERRGEKLGCCGENHWEEMPECPKCGAENVGRDGETYECGDCGNEWPKKDQDPGRPVKPHRSGGGHWVGKP